MERRDFILKIGAVAGAAAVAPVPYAIAGGLNPEAVGAAGKKAAIKVKVYFLSHLADVQDRPDWPNIGYDFRPDMIEMVRKLNAGVPDVEFIPVKANGNDNVRELMKLDAKEGIAGYVCVQMNCWNEGIEVLTASKKPVLYTALPYGGDGGWLTRNRILCDEPNYASIATLNFDDVVRVASAFSLVKKGGVKAYKKEALRIIDEIVPKTNKFPVREDKPACLTPEETLAQLSRMKMLSVSDWNDTAGAKRLKEHFGIETIFVSYDEINAATRNADARKAAVIAAKWKNEAIGIYDVSDEEIEGSARVYVGMKDLLIKHKADAITVNCLGAAYGGHIPHYPCLGFMELQNEGLMGVCENEFNGTPTMLIARTITKGARIGYMSDPVLDYSSRSIIYAHCVCTTKFFGPEGPDSRFEILTHSEDHNGASVRTIAPTGFPETSFIFLPGEKKLLIHTGIIAGNSKDDRACRTKIISEVTGDYNLMSRNWYNWHHVTVIGDIKDAVIAFAKKVGYEVVLQS